MSMQGQVVQTTSSPPSEPEWFSDELLDVLLARVRQEGPFKVDLPDEWNMAHVLKYFDVLKVIIRAFPSTRPSAHYIASKLFNLDHDNGHKISGVPGHIGHRTRCQWALSSAHQITSMWTNLRTNWRTHPKTSRATLSTKTNTLLLFSGCLCC